MKRVLKVIWKWFVRILLALLTLLVLAIFVFYLFRGKIKERAIDYLNTQQPGVVSMGKINLRPFLNFPDVSVQLKNFSYSVGEHEGKDYDTVPVVSLENIYVSFDGMQLLKGRYIISKIKLGDGVINYLVYGDSLTNIEMATGMRFGESEIEEVPQEDTVFFSFDIKDMEIGNLELNYVSEIEDINISIQLNQLNSSFTYLPELITAAVDLQLDLNRVKFENIMLDKPRNIAFSSAVSYDMLEEKIYLNRSLLNMRDVLMELSGEVLLNQNNYMNLRFKATNSGIELLNFLLLGVLDVDAIEQIGSGEIELGGEIIGSFGEQLPELKINFRAHDIGFKVKAINQSVTGISFEGKATNGLSNDFSDASFDLDYFRANFPDGNVDISFSIANPHHPKISLRTSGSADLSLLNEIIETNVVKKMSGKIVLDGNILGDIDQSTGNFLENAGSLTARLENVSLLLPGHEIEKLDGELYLEEKNIGFRNMIMVLDSNKLKLEGQLQNVLPYLMGFKMDANAIIAVESDQLFPGKFMGDSADPVFNNLPIRDVGFNVRLHVRYDQLNRAIKENVIPDLDIGLQNLHFQMPGYAAVSKVNLIIYLTDDQITLNNFRGQIGSSVFDFDARIQNYNAYLDKDSTADVGINFQLVSKLLNPAELLTYNGELLFIPESFSEERITKLSLKGSVETKVSELLKVNGLPNVKFALSEMNLDLKNHSAAFRNFNIEMEHQDSLVFVHRFEGEIGESNFKMRARLTNLFDTTQIIAGDAYIQSDLLDLNELMNYSLISDVDSSVSIEKDSVGGNNVGLYDIDYPDFALNVDVKQIVYGENQLYAIEGRIRSIPQKVIYLDKLKVQSGKGGSLVLDGQLNLTDPEVYLLSATFDIDTLDMSDFDIKLEMNDSIYTLDQNFLGILDANGMAEFHLLPDMSIDLENTTAMFNLKLTDGSVKNFTPLHALANITGNKDLDNVKFGELRNSFTLMNQRVEIPLMSISSTLGQILIEGEQGLDNQFLYLARVPYELVRGTAKNMLGGNQSKKKMEEEEIMEVTSGNFVSFTIYGKGEEFEVKPGDRRERYQQK